MHPLDWLSSVGIPEAGFSLRLTQALLHFLWQGLIVGLLALAAQWSLAGASARLRYRVQVAALLLMLTCLPVTFGVLGAPQRSGRTGSAAWIGTVAIVDVRFQLPFPAAPIHGPASSRDDSLPNWATDANAETARAVERPMQSGRADSLSALLAPIAPYTTAIYLLGVGLMLVRLTAAIWGGQRLRRSATPIADGSLLATIDLQARRLGMKAAPAAAWCRRVSVPVVVGILRPMILLPVSLATGLTPEQVGALLTHELAHIRRYDPLVNLLQRSVEALLFFHPAVWFVSRCVSCERERACDDCVLGVGYERDAYADALIRMAELCVALRRTAATRPETALAASGTSPSQLKRRILRLLQTEAGPRLHLTRCACVLLVSVSASLLLAPAVLQSGVGPFTADLPGDTNPMPQRIEAADRPAGADEPNRPRAVEAVSGSVGRMVEILKQSPVRAPASTERLALFVMDIAKGDVTLVADELNRELTYFGSPSWSHDGQQILFDATPGMAWDKTHIEMIEETGAGVRLTDLGLGNCPSLSPDGKRIAFLLNPSRESREEPGVWVMQRDGSQRRRLGGYGIPKWSPDGRQLLVVSFSTPCKLTLVDGESGEQRSVQLPGHDFYGSVPSWAGDGHTLVAVVASAAGMGIALVDVTEPERAKVKQILWRRGDRLTVEPAYPIYLARSGRCVFVGREKKGQALYTFRDGQLDPPQRLERTGSDGKIASLAFSPDGRYVLFCSDRVWARKGRE